MDPRPTRAPAPDASTLSAFAMTVLFLGTNFVAVRFSNRELPPFWGGAARFAVATVLLVVIVRLLRIPLPRGRALVGALLFGALAFGANFGFLYWGLVWVPAGVASLIFATIPLTTFLLAVTIGLERFRWLGLAGALIVLGGVGAVSLEAAAGAVPRGPLLAVVLASLCAALSGIVVKRFPKSHPLAANAVAMAVGFAMLLGASLYFQEARVLPQRPETWAALAWLVASSIVAFSLMVWVIGRWTASANAYGAVLAPLVTIPAAAGLAGEGVTTVFLAAAGLVLWGVYVGAIHRSWAPATGGRLGSARPDARGPS